MPGYLILDTETTGLFAWDRPAEAEGQPRCASAAMIFAAEDLEVEHEVHHLIRPDGWKMSAEAGAVNGLTTERLAAEGVPMAFVLGIYQAALLQRRIVVAYNAEFDLKVMRGEIVRAGLRQLAETNAESFCVMKAATLICRIPHPLRRGDFKWPKLAEAHAHFFGAGHELAHDALADARAALAVFRELRNGAGRPVERVNAA